MDRDVIKFNGRQYELQPGERLDALLHRMQLATPFAVALNRKFVPKSQYAQVILQASDEVEVVRPVAGG